MVDEIYQSGIEQSYNLSLTGGSEKFLPTFGGLTNGRTGFR